MIPMLDLPGLWAWWKGLKGYWKPAALVLVVLIGGLIAIYTVLGRSIIDPTKAADARAEAEKKKKAEAEGKAKVELAKDMAEVKETREDAVEQSAEDAVDLASELAADREKLVARMRKEGSTP